MSPEFFGGLSAALVALSAVPYIYSAWHRRIQPNVVSWSLWAGIGLALLLTYHGAGANIESIAPVVLGFINPVIIASIALWRSGTRKPLAPTEWGALVFGSLAVLGWYLLQGNPEHVAYALLLAIAADICAAIPTLVFVWRNPMGDRPGAWMMFTTAQLVMLMSITDWSWSSYVLPIYMCIGGTCIWFPLLKARIQKRIPLREWF